MTAKEIMDKARPHAQRIFELARAQIMDIDDTGLCLECGDEAYGVEPDGREYRCEACGAHAVFGAAELLMYL